MSETQAPARATRTRTAERETISDDLIARVIEVTEQRLATRPNPMNLNTFEEIESFAERAARSKMVPKDFQGKPEDIILAVMQGKELGLPPIQAIQSIAMVNGRPAVWGDAVPGLCYARGLVEDHQETFEGTEGKDDFTAICVVKRKGVASPKVGRFSQADAKRAGLYGQAVHGKYPRRMMQWRARHACFHDAFPDVLRGIGTREIEAEDSVATPGWSMPQPEKNWFTVKPQAQADGWDNTWFLGVVQKLANETNAWKWLDLLVACLGDAPTLRDVNEIGDLPVVVTVRETAPDDGKQAIDIAFTAAREKFAEKAETAQSPATDQTPVPKAETQATGEDPNPRVADPVPADNLRVSAVAPPSEERSTQSPTSDGMEFSVWLVDGEGSELPDSDGVFEPFTDPVAFATAFAEVRGNLFPADIQPFEAANADNIDWAMRISEQAKAILTPPAPPPPASVNTESAPALPLNLPPVDQAFIPPPTKSTRAEFTSYVDRFKVLLSAAPTAAAIDHLVTVNSVTTERSDFLNSSRLQIKAAVEERRKALAPPTADMAATMEQLAVDMVGEINRAASAADCDVWAASPAVKSQLLDLSTNAPERHTQVLAALYSRRLLFLIRSCRTQADAAALSRDVALIEQVRWLREHAPLVHKNTTIEMDAHVKGLSK